MPEILPTINFRDIRAKPPRGTQADGFEELYSQLLMDGKLGVWPEGTVLERFGNPDGGREGRAILPDGQVWCWQAKYQWALDSLSGIDESFLRAVELEPRMTRYLVGMPIDLPAGDTATTRSAQTKWDDWVVQKKAELRTAGREIDFAFHGETSFRNLLQPENVGYLRYWFDLDGFAPSDFERIATAALAVAGPRYTPELNVNVPLSEVISGLVHDPVASVRMRELFADFRRATVDESTGSACTLSDAAHDLLHALVLAVRLLDVTISNALHEVDSGRAPASFTGELGQAQDALRDAQGAIGGSSDGQPQQRTLADDLDKLGLVLRRLDSETRSSRWSALVQRALLVTGVGGAGKTHLLVDAVRDRVDRGLPAIAVLGEQISGGPITNELARIIGFGGLASQLLPTLDVAGRSAGAVTLIVIDGLNESQDRSLWSTYLDAFLEEAKSYDNLRVVVSCRTEFLEDTLTATTRGSIFTVEHQGFAQSADAAVDAFASWYGLDRPTFPLTVPEFSNPLLLKLACQSVRDSGARAFPRIVSGFTWLTGMVLHSVELRLAQPARSNYAAGLNLSLQLCTWMAGRILDGDRYVPLSEVVMESERLLPNREWSRSLLFGLLKEGMLSTFWRGDLEMVRFAYERLGDVLAAQQIASLEPAICSAACQTLAANWYQNAGLLDALAVVLPEHVGIELADCLRGEAEYPAKESFLRSLQWRAVDSITERTRQHLDNLFLDHDFADSAWSALLALAPVAGHPFNAEFLHTRLAELELHDRDGTWTIHVNHDRDDADLVGRLSTWAWSEVSRESDVEVVRLSAVALTWSFSSSRRVTRDNATKALVALLAYHPQVASPLLNSFLQVDDAYVEERLLAACFGAAARATEASQRWALADAVSEWIAGRASWPEHLLTRHYVRRVLELASDLGWANADEALLERARPPYQSTLPSPRLTALQVSALNAAPDYAYSSVGHSVLSDFGDFRKYVINHPVQNFRLPEGIDAQHLSQLVFERVLELGWTPERFGAYDRGVSDYRDREDRLERIGKKYQWIAFWQLLGVLTDSFEFAPRFSASTRPYDEPIDVDTPDIDPTMLSRSDGAPNDDRTPPSWFTPVNVEFSDQSDAGWLLNDDAVPDPSSLIAVVDSEGESWTLLEGYYSWEQTKMISEPGERRPPAQYVWMQIRSYIYSLQHDAGLREWSATQDWYGRWMPESGDPYGLYLAEHPRSARWIEASASDDYRQDGLPTSLEVTATSYGGMGGSWDYSGGRGVSGLLPATDVCERLGLRWSGDFAWSNADSKFIASNFGRAEGNGSNAVFVRSSDLTSALQARSEGLFLTALAEKGTYRDGNYPQGEPFARSYSASYIVENGQVERLHGLAKNHLAGRGESSESVGWSFPI